MGVVRGDVVGAGVGVEGVVGEEEEMGTALGSCRGGLLGRCS